MSPCNHGLTCLGVLLGMYSWMAYPNVSWANARDTSANQIENQSENDEKVEQDFDKIRKFYSYDPATGQWSIIEKFKGVDIIEELTEQRTACYLYHNFWAYNAGQKRWYKVDIRDYGYLWSTVLDPSIEKEEKEEKEDSLWKLKNLALGLRLGANQTWYTNKASNMQLVSQGENFFYRYGDDDQSSIRQYRLKWFNDQPKSLDEENTSSSECEENSDDEEAEEIGDGKNTIWKGRGISIPITFIVQYTFLKRLIVGGEIEFIPNYLNHLTHNDPTIQSKKYKIPDWFYHWRYAILVGYKCIRTPTYAWILDAHGGWVFHQKRAISFHTLMKGWAWGIGVNYEKKINDYLKFIGRLSGITKSLREGEGKQNIKYIQCALQLQVGINWNIGKDTEQ